MSYGAIATQISRGGVKVGRSTVQMTCKREIERVDNVSKPRCGAPRVITEEERDRMIDIVDNEDPFIKWRDLTRVCENAHERSVRRLFQDMNRRKWKSLERPHLEPHQAAARLLWAQTYQHFTPLE
jgi:transposase